jgi:hypothetical protein
MKDLMVRTHTFTMLTARLVAIVLFAALLSAVPFHAALAAAPDLGAAGSFAVLGGTAVTCTDSTVTGDVGVYPGIAVTQTNCTINGTVHAADKVAMQARIDFLSAYNALALLPCDYTFFPGGDLGVTLDKPGVYCVEAASTTTNGTLTLDAKGDQNAVWIFKIGTLGTGALTGTGFNVVMINGGQPCNVYWWVAEAVELTDSNFLGTILAGAAITVTRGTFNGDALAQAAVTLTGTTVSACQATGDDGNVHRKCNQGVGNGPEGCDPGNSNQLNQGGDSSRSNDELVGTPGKLGTPGDPGRKGGNK